jgi:hypothetical protein
MQTNDHKTVQLGELVAAVFDEAAHYGTDPEQVSRLATRAVQHMLRRTPSRTPQAPYFERRGPWGAIGFRARRTG